MEQPVGSIAGPQRPFYFLAQQLGPSVNGTSAVGDRRLILKATPGHLALITFPSWLMTVIGLKHYLCRNFGGKTDNVCKPFSAYLGKRWRLCLLPDVHGEAQLQVCFAPAVLLRMLVREPVKYLQHAKSSEDTA